MATTYSPSQPRLGKLQSPEYLRRNLVHAKSVGAREGVKNIITRLGEYKSSKGGPKWLQKALVEVYLRLNELPAELANHRDEVYE